MIAQEQSPGGSVNVNLLTGLGIDEHFLWSDSTGDHSYLTDGLNSTLALADASGNITAQYSYDPFGNTTAVGSSFNALQYTGRENDGTGLYYYRARYYSPALGRFINEDPLGLTGGLNFYLYAGNNPINRLDPLGLDWLNNLTDFSAAAGSVLTFGVTDIINDLDGGSSAINKCSGWHKAGTLTGIGLSTGIGARGVTHGP